MNNPEGMSPNERVQWHSERIAREAYIQEWDERYDTFKHRCSWVRTPHYKHPFSEQRRHELWELMWQGNINAKDGKVQCETYVAMYPHIDRYSSHRRFERVKKFIRDHVPASIMYVSKIWVNRPKELLEISVIRTERCTHTKLEALFLGEYQE